MKLDNNAMTRLHEAIGSGEIVTVYARNKFGTNAELSAKVFNVDPDGVVLDFGTLREGAREVYSTNLVRCNSTFSTSGRIFKTHSLKPGFMITFIIDHNGNNIFTNDEKSIYVSYGLQDANIDEIQSKYCLHVPSYKSSDQYLLALNSLIGKRIAIRDSFSTNIDPKKSGILEYAYVDNKTQEVRLTFITIGGERSYTISKEDKGILVMNPDESITQASAKHFKISEPVKALFAPYKKCDESDMSNEEKALYLKAIEDLENTTEEVLRENGRVEFDFNKDSMLSTFFRLMPKYNPFLEKIKNDFKGVKVSKNYVLDNDKVIYSQYFDSDLPINKTVESIMKIAEEAQKE